jgi:hypothetical protein
MLGNNKERKKKDSEGASILFPLLRKIFDLIKYVIKWFIDG